MPSLSKRFAFPFAMLAMSVFITAAPAQTGATPGGRVVLVLPFDNQSGNASLNWIGDSFPDTLDKRLNSAGFLTISRDDRIFALDHLGLPADFRPSRATTIRIAQQLDANYVIIGSYNVTDSHIAIHAQVLSVDALRMSPPLQDGAELNRLFDAENSIAWKLARAIDPQFSVAEQTFLAAPGAVPLPVFEDYIRGTTATSADERIKRLQDAVALQPSFAAALLELGKDQYAARNFPAAAETLAKVPASDRLALEANFYLGLARFNLANYAGADQAFTFVASRLPLPEVVNNQGVALSRQSKDGAALFQKASEADPSDEDYHYNLSIALFRKGDTAAALQQADAALKLKPHDNEAVQLRARLTQVPAGTKLADDPAGSFSPVTRVRRNYSETGFRQAAFQLDQLRAARMATLAPTERAKEYNQLGQEYLAQGLIPEAEQQFASAIAADARNAAAHAGLAEVRQASGNAKQAREEAAKSIGLQPTAAAYVVLARIDLGDNQPAASATDVSQALHLEPANSAALALRQDLQARGQAVP